MTLIEEIIEKKERTRTNLVKACTALLASVTVLTSCGNAAQANVDKKPALDNDSSISQSDIDSETQSNYEKLMEACRKTDDLGLLQLDSHYTYKNNVYDSQIYISKDRSAYRMIGDQKNVKSDEIVITQNGVAEEADYYINKGDSEFHFVGEPRGGAATTLTGRIQEVFDYCAKQNIKYTINYDKGSNTYTIIDINGVQDGINVRHAITLNSSGTVESYDTYEFNFQHAHYLVKVIGQEEFNQKFLEFSRIKDEYTACFEEEQLAEQTNN